MRRRLLLCVASPRFGPGASLAKFAVLITYVHQYFTTPTQGGGTRSFEMGRRLVQMGHTVRMITTRRESGFGGWSVSEVEGLEVHELGVPYSNSMGNARRIAAFLHFAAAASIRVASLPTDVILATSTPLTVAIPGMIGAAFRRRPLVFEVRDLWPDVPIALGALRSPVTRWLARVLERTAYANSRHVIALAPGMREDIIAKGVEPEKVSVIPNGCDLDLFEADSSAYAAVRAAHPGLGDGPLVVFAGTIGRANGLGYLVEVACHMRRISPRTRFAVVGDGPERPSVADHAKRLGVLGETMFFAGHVSKHDAARWIIASDAVVCLFTGPRVVWKDAVQNKFFDALAAGKPTASNFEGFQSIVARDAGIGIVMDPASPSRGAQQLHSMLSDSEWRRQAAERSSVLAKNAFSRDRLAAELERVLIAAAARPA